MKITTTQLTQLTITGVDGLDPIRVICENYEPGHGRIIIQCWDAAWCAYWGGMSGQTVEQFFCSMNSGYLHSNLAAAPSLRRDAHRARYLTRIILAVQQALRARLPKVTPERAAKLERLAQCNALIEVIGKHGGRFFWSKQGRFARLEMDQGGRLYFRDDYTWKPVFIGRVGGHETRWRGFSHGGTLRDLVRNMRDYITHGAVGEYAPRCWRGRIAPNMLSGGDLWGYGAEAQAAVRAEAFALPIFTTT